MNMSATIPMYASFLGKQNTFWGARGLRVDIIAVISEFYLTLCGKIKEQEQHNNNLTGLQVSWCPEIPN